MQMHIAHILNGTYMFYTAFISTVQYYLEIFIYPNGPLNFGRSDLTLLFCEIYCNNPQQGYELKN
jgi:hypothetical protein